MRKAGWQAVSHHYFLGDSGPFKSSFLGEIHSFGEDFTGCGSHVCVPVSTEATGKPSLVGRCLAVSL